MDQKFYKDPEAKKLAQNTRRALSQKPYNNCLLGYDGGIVSFLY